MNNLIIREFLDINVYSNILYFMVSLTSFYKNEYIMSVLFLMTTIASTLYHINSEKKYLLLDETISVITFTYCNSYIYFSNIEIQFKIFGIFLQMMMIFFLWIGNKYKSDYCTYHPYAHLFGSMSAFYLLYFI